MRLDEDQAAYLNRMLRKRRHSLVIARRAVIEGVDIDLAYTDVNTEIRFIDRMLREVARVMEEKGWRNGQSE